MTSKCIVADIQETILHKKRLNKTISYIPTGADLLDILVGGGEGEGYRNGTIVNFVGDKSSGKTFLACEVIAAAKNMFKDKLKWIYDDCESGFSFDTTRLYGFEIMPTTISQRHKSKTIEDAYCNVREFLEALKQGEFGIYVIDSLDGLDSREGKKIADDQFKAFKKAKEGEKEEKIKGSYRMQKAKYLSDTFFPGLADLIEKKNALLIIISQVRYNVDPMSFEKFTRSGGKAMDFYCHTVLWLANIYKMLKKNRAIGVRIKAKNTKSKTPRPYREVFLDVLFDYGIDNIGSSINFLYDLLTPTGMAKEKDIKLSWDNNIEYTMKQLKEFLIDNKKENYYRKHINKVLKKIELLDWIKADETLFSKLEKQYSVKMSKNELIEYIEKNELQNELKERTVAKWEAIEESIKTKRRPKYQ